MEYGFTGVRARSKQTITVELIDRPEMFELFKNQRYHYSNSKYNGLDKIAFYANGMSMCSAMSFDKIYCGGHHTYEPKSHFIVMVSLRSDIIHDNKNIYKHRSRVFIPFSGRVLSVVENGKVNPDPGLAFKPEEFTVRSAVLDINTRTATFKCESQGHGELEEKPSHHIDLARMVIEPVIQATADFAKSSAYLLYETEERREMMKGLYIRLFNKLGLDIDLAKPMRESLITWLKDPMGDKKFSKFIIEHPKYGPLEWENRRAYDREVEYYGSKEKAEFNKYDDQLLMRIYHMNRSDRMREMGFEDIMLHPDYCARTEEIGSLIRRDPNAHGVDQFIFAIWDDWEKMHGQTISEELRLKQMYEFRQMANAFKEN